MNKLLKKLVYPFYREPSFVIDREGAPYLYRWWLVPKNKFFNVYLHKFVGDDDDFALHDHPWPSLSVILRGKYIEHILGDKVKVFKAGAFIYRPAGYAHRIELFKTVKWAYDLETTSHYIKYKTPRRVWTLFITGKKVREWGFHCPKGWTHWKHFVQAGNEGKTHQGCGGE